MQKRNSRFCQLLCFSDLDLQNLGLEYEKYQIQVQKFDTNSLSAPIPTLLVGWDGVKKNFENCRISSKKLSDNLYWTFSQSEEPLQHKKDIQKFLSKSLKEFLPKTYRTYDCALDGDVGNLEESLFESNGTFCYFGTNHSLYVYGPKGFAGINLASIDYIGSSSVDFVKNVTKKFSPCFLNFDNIPEYLKTDEFQIETLENTSWICSNELVTETSLFRFSPFRLREKELVFFMSKLSENIDCGLAKRPEISQRYSRKDIVNDWLSRQSIHFRNGDELTLKYSNKRTITGRINCVDKRFNPQLLPKKSPERDNIVSRHREGRIAVFDYVSFETKISVLLTKDKSFISENARRDLHVETAKIIFGIEGIGADQRSIGKNVNHSIIYGIGNERLMNFMKESGFNEESSIAKIKAVKTFMKPILENSKRIKEEFKKQGYIVNPYNSVVYPQKEWAVYNNYVQSIAADLVVDKLLSIRSIMQGFKSKFMFQVYDSFVFDLHPEEFFLIDRIKSTLEKAGSHSFEVECVSGNSLMDCTVQKESDEFEYVD